MPGFQLIEHLLLACLVSLDFRPDDERRDRGNAHDIENICPPGRIPRSGNVYFHGIDIAVQIEYTVVVLHLKRVFPGSNAGKRYLMLVSVVYPLLTGFFKSVIIGTVVSVDVVYGSKGYGKEILAVVKIQDLCVIFS